MGPTFEMVHSLDANLWSERGRCRQVHSERVRIRLHGAVVQESGNVDFEIKDLQSD